MLRLGELALRHFVPKGQPSEKLKLRTSSTLWLMLQEEEEQSDHWQNEQEKEATSPDPPNHSPSCDSRWCSSDPL